MELIDYARFSLKALTLRGIGSYLEGQRLELRPLTVLCGENGAGKSTWIKVLRILRQSLESNCLPFGFAIEDWEPNNVQLTNAFYHLATPESIQAVVESDDEKMFGAPGTIGLEFVAQVGVDNGLPPAPHGTAATAFVFNGVYEKGTKFRIRLAHPSHQHDQFALGSIRHVIELTINDRYILRFEGERDPHQRFHENSEFPRRGKPYYFKCSKSVFYGFGNDTEIVEVGQLVDFPYPQFEATCDLPINPSFVLKTIQRIRELLSEVLSSVFDIGAIRLPHDQSHLGDSLAYEAMIRRPHVGTRGEHSWHIEAFYAHKRMRDPWTLGNPEFRASDINAKVVERLFASSLGNRKFERMIECMPDEYKRPISMLRSASGEFLDAPFSEFEVPTSPQAVDRSDLSLPSLSPEFYANALNSIVRGVDLFDRIAWSPFSYYGDPEDPETTKNFNDELLFQLVFDHDLSASELRNYLLIVDAFFDEGSSEAVARDQLPFDKYLSYWLNYLLGVSLSTTSATAKRTGIATPITDGFYEPDPRPFRCIAPLVCESDDWDKQVTATRIHHPCFGKGTKGFVQPPRQLSAAFHQVYPILVQLGVAKAGQLVGIENPEVHLHPALQTKVAELLIAHATRGRTILVETHSDLVVRRVMRALLEEHISQQEVAIYMASLKESVTVELPDDGSASTFYASRIEPLKVDENGRISNWPPGFLDEDVAEARRLMEIMYGGTVQTGLEEEDD